MKKSILALTMVVSLGLSLSAVSAYAWYGGGTEGWYGPRGGYGVNVDDEAYRKFMDETAQIRKDLTVDRAEMRALMAAANPDPAKVREIAERMTDNREKLTGLAREANIAAPRGFGVGPNPNCRGYGRGLGPNENCPNYGKGYGRGFGRCR
jgi:Spy/CpxP family protein refolding chaperone